MAKTTTISGWAAAGMKPPLNAYQLFARELRKSDNTPADVKSSVPKFSTYCSNKWKTASQKTKVRGLRPLGPPPWRERS